jgi:anaerobic selenocysteine-containing dehydrogenase
MGFADEFPWTSLEDILDYRLSRSGRTFAQFESETFMELAPPKFRKYRDKGFATPSGKVELSSSVLGQMGFDPLPYYRELPSRPEEFPYLVFTGVREDPFFQTGQRNIESLRRRMPTPSLYLHPSDAEKEGFADGDWAKLSTPQGSVTAQIAIYDTMKAGHIRVPHGWWYPELRGAADLAGAFISSDAVLCSDEDEWLDHEQGVPHFKGFPGKLEPTEQPAQLTRTQPADWQANPAVEEHAAS